jgi:hypothetical protein
VVHNKRKVIMKLVQVVLPIGRFPLVSSGNVRRIVSRALACAAVWLLCLLSTFQVWSADCAFPPTGLVAWWQGEGNANDIAGANNGTLLNGSTFAPGGVGSAFSFNGISQCVEIQYAPSLINPNYSVEAWVKPLAQVSDPINESVIYGQGFGCVQLVARTGTSGIRIAFGFGSSHVSFHWAVSTKEVPIGQLSHLVGTWDGTTLRLYLNGVLNAQSAPGASPVDSGCPFYIGGIYHSPPSDNCYYVGQFFNGLIDEVSYFNRALPAAEIEAIYNAGSAGKCLGPVITFQPQSQVGYWGRSVTFTVTAAGTTPLSYQWQKDRIFGECSGWVGAREGRSF